tara:strand:- start:159 stop:605 length:447 start_codon:yes stop_codon:yes gene_type:complete
MKIQWKLYKVNKMEWKDILKAELPPKPEAGSAITNETRQAQDEWAREYNQKLVQAIGQLGEGGSSSWCKIDPQSREVTWSLTSGSRTYSYEEFANELKSLLRAVVYGQFKRVNYAFTTSSYLEDANDYVRDMVRNSTASDAFTNWMRK